MTHVFVSCKAILLYFLKETPVKSNLLVVLTTEIEKN